MFGTIGLGEILIIVFDIIVLCIPIFLGWLLFKTLQKISRHSEQIEQEVKALRLEIQSMREKMPVNSTK
jgi:hypothetical protein